MMRNFLVMVLHSMVLFSLQLLENYYADMFSNVPLSLSLTLWTVELMMIGALAYYLMVGNIVTRFAFISFAVVLANGTIEVVFGSDRAYPYIVLWLIFPYVLACWAGAALAALAVKLRSRQLSRK